MEDLERTGHKSISGKGIGRWGQILPAAAMLLLILESTMEGMSDAGTGLTGKLLTILALLMLAAGVTLRVPQLSEDKVWMKRILMYLIPFVLGIAAMRLLMPDAQVGYGRMMLLPAFLVYELVLIFIVKRIPALKSLQECYEPVDQLLTQNSYFWQILLTVSYLDPIFQRIWPGDWLIVRFAARGIVDMSIVLLVVYGTQLLLGIRSQRAGLECDAALFHRVERGIQILFYVAFVAAYISLYLRTVAIWSFPKVTHYIYHIAMWASDLAVLTYALSLPSRISDHGNKQRLRTVLQLLALFSAFCFHIFVNELMPLYVVFVLIVAADGHSFRKILGSGLAMGVVLWVLTYEASMHGYIPYGVSDWKHTFGFDNANSCSMRLLFNACMYLYLRPRKKTSWIPVDLLVLAFTALFLRYAGGRSSILCFALVVAGTVLYVGLGAVETHLPDALHKAGDRLHGTLYLASYWIAMVMSVMTAWFYDPDKPYFFLRLIGRFMNAGTFESRLIYGQKALREYSPKPFGQAIPEGTLADGFFWIDNFYLRMLEKYGYMLLLLFLIFATIALWRCYKRKDYYAMFLFAVFAVLGMLESPMGDRLYNLFPMMTFAVLPGLVHTNDSNDSTKTA